MSLRTIFVCLALVFVGAFGLGASLVIRNELIKSTPRMLCEVDGSTWSCELKPIVDDTMGVPVARESCWCHDANGERVER